MEIHYIKLKKWTLAFHHLPFDTIYSLWMKLLGTASRSEASFQNAKILKNIPILFNSKTQLLGHFFQAGAILRQYEILTCLKMPAHNAKF